MLAYNLEKDIFFDTSEEEINGDEVIVIAYCGKTENLVLTIIAKDFDLCLHNEDENDEIAINLFKEKDKKFKFHLDFFKNEATFI